MCLERSERNGYKNENVPGCGTIAPRKGVVRIRKAELTMDEMKKYEVIKKLMEENGCRDRAALSLGITKRHVNRLIRAYRAHGKAAFIHGNRGAQTHLLHP